MRVSLEITQVRENDSGVGNMGNNDGGPCSRECLVVRTLVQHRTFNVKLGSVRIG